MGAQQRHDISEDTLITPRPECMAIRECLSLAVCAALSIVVCSVDDSTSINEEDTFTPSVMAHSHKSISRYQLLLLRDSQRSI